MLSQSLKVKRNIFLITFFCVSALIIYSIFLESGVEDKIRFPNKESPAVTFKRHGFGPFREKRQSEGNNGVNEDGLPLVDHGYKDRVHSSDSEGLRIYTAFFQKQSGIPQDRTIRRIPSSTETPIKKHHRTSSVWVEKKVRESNRDLNIDSQIFRESVSKSSINEKVANETLISKAAKNRAAVRTLSQDNDGVRFKGLAAIHFHYRTSDGSKVKNDDGLFRDWIPSRWSTRLRILDRYFQVQNGTVKVSSAGVYYVYAQVTYLDEHEINAFEIYKNKDPLFLCTIMTRGVDTKVNACYTGGVTFLEDGDSLFVKNLESDRYAVLLPTHTFFGLVQISRMK